MKTIIAAIIALFAASGLALAHSPAIKDPAHLHPTAKEQKDWGIAGDADKVSRTVHIEMSDDMKFTPNAINVKIGETIRFVVTNKGKVLHEMVIGTPKELKAHAEIMKKHPDMEHDEPYMAHAAPGKSESIIWLFNRPGEFRFACLVPGHYEAGMQGTITVAPLELAGSASTQWASGEIRRVDPDNLRLTIKHGDIKSMDMPPMTMVFYVKDKALLSGLAVQDKIEFQAIAEGKRYIVTDIRKAP